MATILVVDDEVLNRTLMHGILEHRYHVLEAASAHDALSLLGRAPVDLVLLDVMMPERSGIDACPLIKACSPDAYLPVVVITALGEQEDRNAALAAGADEFLTKPVDRHELLLRVAGLLRIRAQEETIRGQLEALRNLDALKEDLVSLLVHDLRNPLSAIFSLLHVLKTEISEPDLVADCQAALDSAARMRDALEDLLEIRMLEEGRLTPRRVPGGLVALAQEALATVRGTAVARGVELVVEAGGGEVLAEIDHRLVRRCVENLVANAIKYSKRGGEVCVAVSRAEHEVVVEVRDRGPGIPDRHKARLFEKFGTIEAVRDNQRRGFGLGLYLVNLVAAAHGGVARALDREGGGTVFRVTLETS